MKKVALLVLSCGFFAFGTSQSLSSSIALQVEKDLNGHFSETVNEGETTAEVQNLKGIPQVKCSNVVYNKGRKIVFCTAEIKTTYGENMQSFGYATCTSLGYLLNDKGEITDRYNPELFSKCLEKVYDPSYD